MWYLWVRITEVGADCFRIPDIMFNPSFLQVLIVMEVLWIMKSCWPSLDAGRGFFAFTFGLNCWLILINLVGLVQTIPGMEKFGPEVNSRLQGLPQMVRTLLINFWHLVLVCLCRVAWCHVHWNWNVGVWKRQGEVDEVVLCSLDYWGVFSPGLLAGDW